MDDLGQKEETVQQTAWV